MRSSYGHDPRDVSGLPLFGPKLARSTDPASSHLAADEHVATGRHAEQCAVVLGLVIMNPGLTSRELADRARLPGYDRFVVARRLPDLEKKGAVKKGGMRICQSSGVRQAVTWWPSKQREET